MSAKQQARRVYSWNTIKKAIGILEGRSDDDIYRSLMAASVKKATLKGYRTECKRLLSWITTFDQIKLDSSGKYRMPGPGLREYKAPKEEGSLEEDFVKLGRTCTRIHYFSFLYSHSQVHPLQFKRIRATIRLGQLMARVEVWATSQDSMTAEKAAQRLGQIKSQSTRRATLDEEMLSIIIIEAKKKNQGMARAMTVQAYGCFRISELIGMRIEDVTPEGVWLFDEKRDRVATTSSLNVKRSLKRLRTWTGGWRALKALHDRVKEMGEGPGNRPLFPRSLFTLKQYNDHIKVTATLKNWGAGLKIDGCAETRWSRFCSTRIYTAKGTS